MRGDAVLGEVVRGEAQALLLGLVLHVAEPLVYALDERLVRYLVVQHQALLIRVGAFRLLSV